MPISIAEQVESTQAAFEAGAAIVHCHVRDDEGRPTAEPARFARLKADLVKHCRGPSILQILNQQLVWAPAPPAAPC